MQTACHASFIALYAYFFHIDIDQRLSFTSGLLEDKYDLCPFGDYETCTRKLYENTPRSNWTEPGTSFQYLSGHLQFAGAMAVAASKMKIEALFEKYLYRYDYLVWDSLFTCLYVKLISLIYF